MTNVMKKIGAALLALALVVTMMPFLAVDSFAADGDKAFDYSVNGHVLGSVTDEWLESNSGDPQLFPYAGDKGNNVGFVIAAGPSYATVFRNFYGVSMGEIPEATVVWYTGPNFDELTKYTNNPTVQGIIDASGFYTLKDKGGNPFEYPLTSTAINVRDRAPIKAVFDENKTVEPVLAIARETFFETNDSSDSAYSRAEAVMDSFTNAEAISNWMTGHAISDWIDATPAKVLPVLGGNKNASDVLYDSKAQSGTANFCGKFAAKKALKMDLEISLNEVTENVELTVGDTKAAAPDLGVPEGLSDLILRDAVWASDKEEVATVADGTVTAKGEGSCVVTAKLDDKVLATYNVTVKSAPAPTPAPTPAPKPAPTVKNGMKAKVGGNTYKVISAKAKTVAFVKAANKTSATVPATVKVKGVKLAVTSIAPKAFKGTKVKTLTVKSKKLTKKSVKGSLKSSKVKTVKVKVGTKKINKKYVKKYKKIFTKKNAGKKVKVK